MSDTLTIEHTDDGYAVAQRPDGRWIVARADAGSYHALHQDGGLRFSAKTSAGLLTVCSRTYGTRDRALREIRRQFVQPVLEET